MAAAKVLDIWMRDCCAGFWGTVQRSGVTLPLFEIITSLLWGRKKKKNTHTLCLLHTLTHTHTRCSHQVHGGATGRMWLDEQLRWRLSNTLDLSLGGLQQKREKDTEEREEERDGGREERESGLSVSIRIKVMGQCVT